MPWKTRTHKHSARLTFEGHERFTYKLNALYHNTINNHFKTLKSHEKHGRIYFT